MEHSQSKHNILVSGAGPSGLVLAWWLSHYGMKSTVLERATALRSSGQSLDIQGPSLKIVEKMGLLSQFQARKTHEAGLAFVDEKDHAYAKVPMGAAISLTNEIEVLRGDMVQIWYDAVKDDPNVSFKFGTYITNVTQDAESLEVTLKSGEVLTEFDLLVVADGMNSRTRGLVFDNDVATLKGLGVVCGFFSIPWEKHDGNWAKYYSTAGRQVMLRPHPPSGTAAHLGISTEEAGDYLKMDTKAQKQLLHKLFTGVGWEAPRVLKHMDDAKDFYMAEFGQVICRTWRKGRVVLTGDAAHCPSPISGTGVTLSVLGAYVLAGELASRKSFEEAFAAYEAQLRPHVNTAQTIPPGVPGIACPKTLFGVRMFRAVMRVLLAKRVLGLLVKMASALDGDKKKAANLPEYTITTAIA